MAKSLESPISRAKVPVVELGNDATLGPASRVNHDRAEHEEKRRIFDEALRAWRQQLADLQERLSSHLVNVALANREAIAGDPLDWVRSRLEDFWAARRAGFRNWPAVGCDPPADPKNPDADLPKWRAPEWLLGQLPPFVLAGLDAMALEEQQPPAGRLPLLHTTEILNSIAARIEMSLFMVSKSVLDRATISLASERVRMRGSPSKQTVEALRKAESAIASVHGQAWNRLFIQSTTGLYAALHAKEGREAQRMGLNHAGVRIAQEKERAHDAAADEAPPKGEQPKRPEKLREKKQDLSRYFEEANLTDAQREVISLNLEYESSVTAIAKRLHKHRSTIQEILDAAKRKIEASGDKERRARKRAVRNPGSLD